MGKRELARRILGDSITEGLISTKRGFDYLKARLKGYSGKICFEKEREYHIYSQNDKNVFFGYYDLQPYDVSEERLLAHIVGKKANPQKEEAEVGYFDTRTKEWNCIANTRAWCWQQGARLRWHPIEQNKVIYNDVEDAKYVSRVTDIVSGTSDILCRALYDIDKTFSYGLSLNFSRLQRLRPGYGYNSLPDETISDRAPQKDGVFRIDLRSGQETLLFSVAELAQDISQNGEHYINHLCFSPDGKQFIFFHLWNVDYSPWSMRFYVSDIDGKNLRCLEKELTISHYCWIDDTKILVTSCCGKYIVYNTVTGEKKQIEESHLVRDGHPSVLANGFLSDTYPIKKTAMQHVFRINEDGTDYIEIARVFADPRCFGEHRCDLHPRVMKSGKVNVDTTCKNGVRSILEFELLENER